MQQRHMLVLSSVAVSTYGSRVEVAEQPCGARFPFRWFWEADYDVSFLVGLGEHYDVDKSVSRGFWN